MQTKCVKVHSRGTTKTLREKKKLKRKKKTAKKICTKLEILILVLRSFGKVKD